MPSSLSVWIVISRTAIVLCPVANLEKYYCGKMLNSLRAVAGAPAAENRGIWDRLFSTWKMNEQVSQRRLYR